MTINCNVAGEERKRLAEVISQHVGIPKRYAGMPSCAYLIGDIKVSKDGKVTRDGEDDKLLSVIKAEGFIPIENRMQKATMIMLYAGLRRGELLALQYDDVWMT